jgi:hypothetical protein
MLSPAGDRLYLTGSTTSVTEEGAVREPVGLLEVDTADGALLSRLDAPIGQGALSADGTRLLVTATQETWVEEDEPPSVTGTDVLLLEADGLRELARFPVGAGSTIGRVAGASWDGRLGYVLWSLSHDPGTFAEVSVIDLTDGSSVAESPMRLTDLVPLGT